MNPGREIATLQEDWQAAAHVLAYHLIDTRVPVPSGASGGEAASWEAYRERCREAGVCLRVDCYLPVAGGSALCAGHQGEYESQLANTPATP